MQSIPTNSLRGLLRLIVQENSLHFNGRTGIIDTNVVVVIAIVIERSVREVFIIK